MDAVAKIILVPICGVFAYALIIGGLFAAGVDVGELVAGEKTARTFEVCSERWVPRPDVQTAWGPTSGGADKERTCRMVTR